VPLYRLIVLRHWRATPPGDYAVEFGLWHLRCNRHCRVLGIRSASEQEALSGGFMSETGTFLLRRSPCLMSEIGLKNGHNGDVSETSLMTRNRRRPPSVGTMWPRWRSSVSLTPGGTGSNRAYVVPGPSLGSTPVYTRDHYVGVGVPPSSIDQRL
jgi:hypothetical protein